MSSCYFMYDNLISNPAMISLSSAAPGTVGMPAPAAAGSATAHASGQYTGDVDQVFLVEIDSMAEGSQIGQATFRWRRTDREVWEATELPTAGELTELADGVAIKWVSGGGDDFVLGDSWSVLAVRPHGATALLDNDRDQCWISQAAGDQHLTVDLGSAQNVQALILADHNLGDAATATLMANSADAWADPPFSLALGRTAPHLVAFLDQTFRYWRLVLDDPANPDGRLQASGLYLGGRYAPSRTFGVRYTRSTLAGRRVTTTDSGKLAGHATSLAEALALEFSGLTDADATSIRAMYRAIHDQATGRLTPLYFTPFAERPADTIFCLPGPDLQLGQTHQGRWSLKLNLEEVVRTDV